MKEQDKTERELNETKTINLLDEFKTGYKDAQ